MENLLIEDSRFLSAEISIGHRITIPCLNSKMNPKSPVNMVMFLLLCCLAVVHTVPDISRD